MPTHHNSARPLTHPRTATGSVLGAGYPSNRFGLRVLGVFIPRPGGVFKIWGVDVGTTQKPRIPDVGFRGLEVT